VSENCYKGDTKILQEYYKSVTRVLQEGHKSVTRMSHHRLLISSKRSSLSKLVCVCVCVYICLCVCVCVCVCVGKGREGKEWISVYLSVYKEHQDSHLFTREVAHSIEG
jgi:hypothetical protein